MKCFFDCEFTGLHKNTTLISIGIIAENGNRFYWEFTDYDKSQMNEWLRENVIAHTSYLKDKNNEMLASLSSNLVYSFGTKERCAAELKMWLNHLGEEVELVSDVCHYDMVLFCDIFGSAFDIPKCVAPTCIDINQMIAEFHETPISVAFDVSREGILATHDIKIEGSKHNALYDAKVIREVYKVLTA